MAPKTFTQTHVVSPEDIDFLGHVNNIVYLQLLLDVANKHWCTIAPDDIQQSIRWVVRKHTIEYFAPAFLGNELEIKTWIAKLEGVKCHRAYEILLQGKRLVGASTDWVSVHPSTMKPKRVGESILPYFFV